MTIRINEISYEENTAWIGSFGNGESIKWGVSLGKKNFFCIRVKENTLTFPEDRNGIFFYYLYWKKNALQYMMFSGKVDLI